MLLTCVILNYNDSDTTISLHHKIKDYHVLDKIVIVDGASTDDSYEKLAAILNEKTVLLSADRNGGYGYGNNIGIRYSSSLGAKYVLIANPDVEFSEHAIIACLNMIKKNENSVAVAPRIQGRQPAFSFAPPLKDTLSSSIILNKFFSPRYYPPRFFLDKNFCEVFALPGSLVMFDIDKFMNCGLYDEEVFLYNEEVIIGKKFKEYGYKSILCLNESYQHFHSVSVGKAYKTSLKPKKFELASHALYLRKYCNAGKLPLALLSLIKPLTYLECLIWPWLKSKIHGK